MIFQSYDSFEEMQADLAAKEDAANASLHPLQVTMRDQFFTNDVEPVFWFRPYPEGGCYIFGHAWSFQEACEASAKYVPNLATAISLEELDEYEESLDEAVYEIRTLVETRRRGYLRGEAFSILEPRGELGDTHVANAMPISRDAFEEVKAANWQPKDVDPVTLEVVGRKAARQAGWCPIFLGELRMLQAQL